MCCFTNRVDHVGNTRIFARGLDDGYQYLVYAMEYAAQTELAMILPIPTPPTGEALIRVLYSGICGTDLELERGYYPYDGILGHEFVGVVESLWGDANPAQTAKWVNQRYSLGSEYNLFNLFQVW